MRRIDATGWDAEVKTALENMALSGGAIVDVDDNLQIVVLDARLWESLSQRLPALSEIIRDIRELGSTD